MRKLLITFLLTWAAAEAGAQAESKAAIGVVDPKVDQGVVSSHLSVRNAEEGALSFEVKELAFGKGLSFSASPSPVNLIILVDASQLCKTYQIDGYVAGLMGSLKRSLARGSRVSLATFTATTLEVMASDKAVSELENLSIRCEPGLVSTSYEKALNRVLDSAPKSDLKTAVWVLTSGNIQVGNSLVQELNKRHVSVHLLLYNAIMEKELARVVEHQNTQSGRRGFSLSVLQREEKILPERWFDLRVTVPGYLKENVLAFSVAVKKGDTLLGSENVSARVDLNGRGFWANYGTLIGLIGSLLLVTAILVGLIRFYRPQACGQCGKWRRHGEGYCVQCASGEAHLVGQFNHHQKAKQGKWDVVYLAQARNEIGFKRHHAVRLNGKMPGKALAATIQVETAPDGKRSYLLVPSHSESIFVNGALLRRARYLGDGDEIHLFENRLTFLNGGSENEVRA